MGKYGRARQATDNSMMHALCRRKITNTLNLCCFSTAAGYSNARECTVYTYNASLVVIIIIIYITIRPQYVSIRAGSSSGFCYKYIVT